VVGVFSANFSVGGINYTNNFKGGDPEKILGIYQVNTKTNKLTLLETIANYDYRIFSFGLSKSGDLVVNHTPSPLEIGKNGTHYNIIARNKQFDNYFPKKGTGAPYLANKKVSTRISYKLSGKTPNYASNIDLNRNYDLYYGNNEPFLLSEDGENMLKFVASQPYILSKGLYIGNGCTFKQGIELLGKDWYAEHAETIKNGDNGKYTRMHMSISNFNDNDSDNTLFVRAFGENHETHTPFLYGEKINNSQKKSQIIRLEGYNLHVLSCPSGADLTQCTSKNGGEILHTLPEYGPRSLDESLDFNEKLREDATDEHNQNHRELLQSPNGKRRLLIKNGKLHLETLDGLNEEGEEIILESKEINP
jgi:hypothetical protein